MNFDCVLEESLLIYFFMSLKQFTFYLKRSQKSETHIYTPIQFREISVALHNAIECVRVWIKIILCTIS